MLTHQASLLAVTVYAVAITSNHQPFRSSCADLYQSGEYARALAACQRQYSSTSSPAAGIMAARSALRLGRRDETLQWIDRLKGTDQAANALVLAGFIHEQQQQRTRAKDDYVSAAQLYRRAGDSARAADVLYRLFYLSWQASDHRDAFVFAAQSFEQAAKTKDRQRERLALEGLFSALYEIGDLESARHVLDELDGLIPQDDAARLRLSLHRGALLLSESRPEPARSFLEAALRLAPGDSPAALLSIRLNLAEAALLVGDLQTAETNVKAAEQIAARDPADRNHIASLAFYESWLNFERRLFADAAKAAARGLKEEVIPDWRWSLLLQLGRAEEARGRPRVAERAYQDAIDVVEGLRAAVGNDEFKEWLLDRRRQPFEALFRIKIGRGEHMAALAVVERAKARAFQDAFIQSASAAGPQSGAPWSINAATDRLEALRNLMPAGAESIAAALPSVTELVHTVGDRHVFVYFQAGEELWLVTISRRNLNAWSVGRADEIRRLADRLISRPDDLKLAAVLGELLLPESSLPPPGSTLYIVPDRSLSALPFASLRRRDRWAVEQFVISYLPSVSALHALESRRNGAAGPPVVIGNPDGDLAAADKEANWVSSQLRVNAHTRERADRGALKQATGSQLLHVAAHTWVAPGGPWLKLSDDRISASVVIRDRIRPQIAVLASCSGARARGGGYWGSWGAAFLAAGTPSVIASLWSVGDAQSFDFVRRFYESGGAANPAAALAEAQRYFIERGLPPSFWAPFVHMGLAGGPKRAA
jgi:tetratricopeptide (TPR) repeat protein